MGPDAEARQPRLHPGKIDTSAVSVSTGQKREANFQPSAYSIKIVESDHELCTKTSDCE